MIRDRSGSCAIVCVLTDQNAYIVNVGDSRAIISSENGSYVKALSTDHKPEDDHEQARIKRAGGSVY